MSVFTRFTSSISAAASSAKESLPTVTVGGVLRTAGGLIAGGIVAFVGFHLVAFLLAVAAWVIAALAALALAIATYYVVKNGVAGSLLGAMSGLAAVAQSDEFKAATAAQAA